MSASGLFFLIRNLSRKVSWFKPRLCYARHKMPSTLLKIRIRHEALAWPCRRSKARDPSQRNSFVR